MDRTGRTGQSGLFGPLFHFLSNILHPHSVVPPPTPSAPAASPGPGRQRTPPPTYADVIEEDRRKMDSPDVK